MGQGTPDSHQEGDRGEALSMSDSVPALCKNRARTLLHHAEW